MFVFGVLQFFFIHSFYPHHKALTGCGHCPRCWKYSSEWTKFQYEDIQCGGWAPGLDLFVLGTSQDGPDTQGPVVNVHPSQWGGVLAKGPSELLDSISSGQLWGQDPGLARKRSPVASWPNTIPGWRSNPTNNLAAISGAPMGPDASHFICIIALWQASVPIQRHWSQRG